MSSLAQNNAVIKSAFARFKGTSGAAIREGMMRLTQAGLDYLVDAHEMYQSDLLHTQETNTLAYAMAHDGVIVDSAYLNGMGGDLPGNAVNKAREILAGTKGWVAIILSEMEGWYRVDWEMDFLNFSKNEIRQNFHRFFKRIR